MVADGLAPGGRVIRHAPLAAPVAVGPLVVTMIAPAFRTLLMPRVGGPALLPTRERAAVLPAVRLAPVAGPADMEDRAAPATPARVPPDGAGHRPCPDAAGALAGGAPVERGARGPQQTGHGAVTASGRRARPPQARIYARGSRPTQLTGRAGDVGSPAARRQLVRDQRRAWNPAADVERGARERAASLRSGAPVRRDMPRALAPASRDRPRARDRRGVRARRGGPLRHRTPAWPRARSTRQAAPSSSRPRPTAPGSGSAGGRHRRRVVVLDGEREGLGGQNRGRACGGKDDGLAVVPRRRR